MKLKYVPLNKQVIESAIQMQYKPMLHSIDIFDMLDSTNTYLFHQLKLGAASGHVCLAEVQSAGRGRLGRQWVSERGNIYCSLLWRFSPTVVLEGLSIAVAVMVLQAILKTECHSGFQLKWPNDILFQERKLAGILLEAQQKTNVVIGIGINLLTAEDPSRVGLDAIFSQEVNRNQLIGTLLNELCCGLTLFQEKGLRAFHASWTQHDYLKDKPIILTTQPQAILGIAEGINEQGELLVKKESGLVQSFGYGEVSVRLAPISGSQNTLHTITPIQ